MALEALARISNDLIATSWKASTAAYSADHFHKQEEGDIVFFSFKPFSLEKDWFDPENESSFGETKMKSEQFPFPCMRSFSNDVDATANQAFLKNLHFLISPSTSFRADVADSQKRRRIVFTGHSSGGATAILATVWYLEKYFTKKSDGPPFPEPICVTFGAPLVGDNVFKHALGRENWSRFFVNFVTRFDIVPRIMLATKASTEQALPYALSQLGRRAPIQGIDQTIAGFYAMVMKDVETAARQAACELIGDGGNAFLETFSSFLELSPYRPAGTFVFSTETRLVEMNNSDAILQILFYASQSSNEQELSQRPNQSIIDHHRYEKMVRSMGMKDVNYLDKDHLPLDEFAFSDLGLSTSAARECVCAAFEAENKRVENQSKINDTFFKPINDPLTGLTKPYSKIVEKLLSIEEYKLRCLTPPKGYYDSFKESNEEKDFKANVARAELAGSFDEVLGLMKKGQLPDGFEGDSKWIELATRNRRLMEPLDISNYHRHLKNEDTGPYMGKGRPSRYKHAQRLYEHGLTKEGSSCGSCFWADVEELRGKQYETVEADVKNLERSLQGWITDEEVDHKQIFLEGSTFSKWWQSLPAHHKGSSTLQHNMG